MKIHKAQYSVQGGKELGGLETAGPPGCPGCHRGHCLHPEGEGRGQGEESMSCGAIGNDIYIFFF